MSRHEYETYLHPCSTKLLQPPADPSGTSVDKPKEEAARVLDLDGSAVTAPANSNSTYMLACIPSYDSIPDDCVATNVERTGWSTGDIIK